MHTRKCDGVRECARVYEVWKRCARGCKRVQQHCGHVRPCDNV